MFLIPIEKLKENFYLTCTSTLFICLTKKKKITLLVSKKGLSIIDKMGIESALLYKNIKRGK